MLLKISSLKAAPWVVVKCALQSQTWPSFKKASPHHIVSIPFASPAFPNFYFRSPITSSSSCHQDGHRDAVWGSYGYFPKKAGRSLLYQLIADSRKHVWKERKVFPSGVLSDCWALDTALFQPMFQLKMEMTFKWTIANSQKIIWVWQLPQCLRLASEHTACEAGLLLFLLGKSLAQ